jgi:hypothetical protein
MYYNSSGYGVLSPVLLVEKTSDLPHNDYCGCSLPKEKTALYSFDQNHYTTELFFIYPFL